ncbi:MAG: hypothetical protein GX802_06530, partial [Clostridiales bacterium]|nr:hypothetical protein [Clostridiales bacterium]
MRNFEEWLLEHNKMSNSSAYKYARAINIISDDMIREEVIKNSLYSYSNLQELDIAIEKIVENRFFIDKNLTGHNMYSS